MADNKSREVRNVGDLYVNDYYSHVNTIGKSTEDTADKIGQSFENLSVKVDLDCSDALAGLKALQREARKASQAIAELDSEADRVSAKIPDTNDISDFTTAELTEELAKREGVRAVNFYTDDKITVSIKDTFGTGSEEFTGPARVLVVTD